ncbi:ribokinase [Corynebacterium urealyticum]|uniref:ribokinase n=1 Tax=Corynebacterium urealyticum TaxID=43771 RepID=UPI0011E7A5E5|nr:ribokinase [Corynebacterium urealyticum]TYR16007.1 ribokinase [Corynebacterium urealyticum]
MNPGKNPNTAPVDAADTPASVDANSNAAPAVLVCGSINVDTFVGLDEFPHPGETIIGRRGLQGLGGKGANQAVASARMGVETILLGAMGETSADNPSQPLDPLALLAIKELDEHGVNTAHIARTNQPTGQAFIMNDASGENIIIVTSGANELTSPAELTELAKELADDRPIPVVLAQGELTPEHSAELPALAEAIGARLILNLAPVTTKDADLVAASDPIILNELEAADITGLPRETPTEELFAALKDVARTCVVTLGPAGAAVIDEAGVTRVPAPQMETIVDTTGAGDAFCGTLAAAVATGSSLVDATRVAVAAGSLATQKAGAAASYATEAEIRDLAAEQENRS